MSPLLTIVIPAYNASHFLDNILYSLKKLTFFDYKVLVCVKESSFHQKQKMERVAQRYENTEVFFHQQATTGSTGIGKGNALNILINKIDTPYGVMMDADAVFLKKDWDKILLSYFGDKIKIGGAPRVSEGYLANFPDSYLTIFDTKVFKGFNINMMPKDISKGQDVGWEMYGKFTGAGYKAIALLEKNTRNYKAGPFRDLLGVGEYYLNGYEHIFASHFGRGSTYSGSAKYRKGTSFIYRIPKIGRLFRMLKGKKEIKKWLKICREIVEKQI